MVGVLGVYYLWGRADGGRRSGESLCLDGGEMKNEGGIMNNGRGVSFNFSFFIFHS
jgi:hypothetical protein